MYRIRSIWVGRWNIAMYEASETISKYKLLQVNQFPQNGVFLYDQITLRKVVNPTLCIWRPEPDQEELWHWRYNMKQVYVKTCGEWIR